MEKHEDHFSAPLHFPFPFTPYSIQNDFMKHLYQAIEEKKIGIFESPTGTGKSLSLICGALTWLRDHEQHEDLKMEKISGKNVMQPIMNQSSDVVGDEPDWVREFAESQSVATDAKQVKRIDEKRKVWKKKLAKMRQGTTTGDKVKIYKRKKPMDETLALMERARKEIENHEKGVAAEDTEFDELVPREYDSNSDDDEVENGDDDAEDGITRIYFCSRTHSQLSQFVRELQKSPFGVDHATNESAFQVSVTTLGSRNSLCINESVRRLRSLQLINERCSEMQKNSKREANDENPEQPRKRRRRDAAKTACCYYSNHEGMSRLSNLIVSKVLDIEDVAKEGKSLEACPYYATRRSVPFSQLVVLPYQTLLHHSARESSGLRLKDSVIIIDEAHNLVEAMNNMYSVKITRKQASQAQQQLSSYQEKFSKRLKAKNLFYVKQLIFVLRRFLEVMNLKKDSTEKPEKLLTINDFLFEANLDNINFFKLLKYCTRSQISKKLRGFVEKCETGAISSGNTSSLTTFLKEVKNSSSEQKPPSLREAPTKADDVTMRSPMMLIESFFSSLTSSSHDGRIAVTKSSAEASLKFLMLNPSFYFKDILDQCRALIVAGGTMQPSSCLIDQLLAQPGGADHRSRIVEFSCGHVIDGSKQLLPLALSSGPTNESLEFTFDKRTNKAMIDEVGRILMNACNLVPGGIVCFFASYEYENIVHKRWSESGLLQKLEAKKKVFREPKRSDQLDTVLKEYSTCIERSRSGQTRVTGAILLSVVGGKMSEGINFSDWLGRCVVMVGLPYPNLYSLELKEKMDYLTKNMPRDKNGRTAGQAHYEDLCMKAVNQSIGRAIRHRNDYACILLLDKRYHKASISSKLPQWISEHLRNIHQFGHTCAAMRKFFKSQDG